MEKQSVLLFQPTHGIAKQSDAREGESGRTDAVVCAQSKSS